MEARAIRALFPRFTEILRGRQTKHNIHPDTRSVVQTEQGPQLASAGLLYLTGPLHASRLFNLDSSSGRRLLG